MDGSLSMGEQTPGGGAVYGGLRMAMGAYACYGCLGIYGFL